MYFSRFHNHHISIKRIKALQGVIFFLFLLIVFRLFYIQVIKHNYYLNIGLNQRAVMQDVQPERGGIYALESLESGDKVHPLAINKVYYNIIANPSKITRPQNITDILVEVLELEEEIVLEKVKKENRYYENIAKNIDKIKVNELEGRLEILRQDINKNKEVKKQAKNISDIGIIFEKNVLRLYPDKEVGAHILGFLGYGNGNTRIGSYGLEGYYENELSGKTGHIIGEKDSAGRLLSSNQGVDAQDGADIFLTIDNTIQYTACKELEKAIVRYDAESGSVIILETKTGEIKAMCNYPSFDPNEYNIVESSDAYNNNTVYHNYEPGSVMKAISMAIAIDQGKVDPNTVYEDTGEVKYGGYPIKNAGGKIYGWVDMKEVLASSINTGMIFATSEVNNKIFEEYIKKFGFGKLVDIGISQESRGDISQLARGKDIYKATTSYGQGVTVTPLQMVNAINVIANRGKLVQPYIVKRIEYSNGEKEEFYPQEIRQVIDPSTAATVSAMMVHVVDGIHGDKAGVQGYYVAGKTGTAQVANDKGKYDKDKTIHNFVGFAPNDNPKFTMITKLDYPTAAKYSSDTAAPLFGDIAKFLLEYYNIPPNR